MACATPATTHTLGRCAGLIGNMPFISEHHLFARPSMPCRAPPRTAPTGAQRIGLLAGHRTFLPIRQHWRATVSERAQRSSRDALFNLGAHGPRAAPELRRSPRDRRRGAFNADRSNWCLPQLLRRLAETSNWGAGSSIQRGLVRRVSSQWTPSSPSTAAPAGRARLGDSVMRHSAAQQRYPGGVPSERPRPDLSAGRWGRPQANTGGLPQR